MKKQNLDAVVPSISVEGYTHPWVLAEKAGELPEMKAVGYSRLPGGQWVSYVVTFQGARVIKVEVEEPNLRAIAEESAKMAFVTNFVDADRGEL